MHRSVIATSLASGILLVAAFAYLARRDHNVGLRIWAWAFVIGVFRNGLELAAPVLGGGPWVGLLFGLCLVSQGYLLSLGTFRTLGRSAPLWWAVLAIAALGWAALPLIDAISPRTELVPLFAGLAIIHAHAGLALLRSPGPGIGRVIAGISFILWGLHRANYPFLRGIEWFAPWGYGIATALAMALAFGFLVHHFECAVAEVQTANAKYRELVDRAVIGVFRTSVKGRFEEANPALAAMLGYDSVDELKAIDIASQMYANPEIRARVMMASREDRAAGYEIEWLRKDRTPITVEITGRTIKDSAGNPVAYEGMARDVTRERELSAQLARSQRVEVVGRLAGGIAHDFNNLLTAIQLYASMVERKLTDPEQRRDLAEIQNATARASALTQQLLALGRRQLARPHRIDLGVELRRVVRMLSRTLGDEVVIELAVPEQVVPVFADPMQIEQILVNLAINARDAMAEGGTLSIALHYRPHAAIGEAGISLVVADDGAGIPADKLPHIFEPFFTMKEASGGTGLGLASVEAVVTEIGGEITVESTEGRGTTFYISLNEAVGVELDVAGRAPSNGENELPVISARILVVDDRPGVRTAMARALREVGANVAEELNGATALARIEASPDEFDLVVSDVAMPRMGGRSLADRAKRTAPGLPFLFVSGNVGAALADVLGENEAFLAKPFTAAELVQACHAVLTRRET